VVENQTLLEQFEGLRPHLQAIAYRMLGSASEAQDAVQECWIRLTAQGPEAVEDLRGWLTVVIGRICLDLLRRRRSRPEEPVGTWLPEPLVDEDTGPEDNAILADSVGLALLVVLETLTPAERLAFVLHDVFAVPFDEIAGIIDKSPAAVRQLASRARRRVRRDAPPAQADRVTQRRLVAAFLAASRAGEFNALLEILHEDVVFRADAGPNLPFQPISGIAEVAGHVLSTAPRFAPFIRTVLVNGSPGALAGTVTQPIAVIAFTVVDERIAAIDIIADPAKLRALNLDQHAQGR
jgi:RNA polymerase sigma-70 factor, ECF subfamily